MLVHFKLYIETMAVEDVSIIIKEKQTNKIVPLLKEVASPQNVDCFSDQAKFNRKGLLRQVTVQL